MSRALRQPAWSAFGLGLCLTAALWAPEALAQMAENNQTAGVVEQFRVRMRAAQATIIAALNATFWLLASIEFTLAMVFVALNDQGITGFVREVLIRILFIGFFWTLLQNGIGWTDSIIATLSQLGASAGGIPVNGMSPDRIVDLGVGMMQAATFEFSILDIGSSLALIVAAGIAFIAILLIAANLALVLIEFYIVGYGGIILLALGGSRWTSNYAVAYLKYTLAIGMRLFVFYLIAGVGMAAIGERIENQLVVDNINQFWALAGFSVVLCVVASRAPSAITGLIQGVSTSANIGAQQGVQAAASGATLATGGLAPALGAAAAATQAVKLGHAQAGNSAANAVSALAKAGVRDVKGSVGGTGAGGSVFPRSGTAGGRMAVDMAKQREAIVRKPLGDT